jgi:hypothetical protein
MHEIVINSIADINSGDGVNSLLEKTLIRSATHRTSVHKIASNLLLDLDPRSSEISDLKNECFLAISIHLLLFI